MVDPKRKDEIDLDEILGAAPDGAYRTPQKDAKRGHRPGIAVHRGHRVRKPRQERYHEGEKERITEVHRGGTEVHRDKKRVDLIAEYAEILRNIFSFPCTKLGAMAACNLEIVVEVVLAYRVAIRA